MDESVKLAARAEVEEFQRKVGTLREEIGKVIVGNREVVDGVLTCMLAGSHALLETTNIVGTGNNMRSIGSMVRSRLA